MGTRTLRSVGEQITAIQRKKQRERHRIRSSGERRVRDGNPERESWERRKLHHECEDTRYRVRALHQ